MSEDTTKISKGPKPGSKANRVYNKIALEHTATKYGVTKTYVRQSINGIRVGITCDTIVKEYNANVFKINEALKS